MVIVDTSAWIEYFRQGEPGVADKVDLCLDQDLVGIGDLVYCEVTKERVGNTTTLWGGIMHEHLISGTPGQIREDARYAFTHAAPGGGFILGSSHSLAVGARIENVEEMKRCRDEWGNYPMRRNR